MIITDASVVRHWSKNTAKMVEAVGGGGVCEAESHRPLIWGPRVPALWLCGPKHTAGSVKSGAPLGRTAFALWIKYHCNTHIDITRHQNTKERLCRSLSNREERPRTRKVSRVKRSGPTRTDSPWTQHFSDQVSQFKKKQNKTAKPTNVLHLNDSVQSSYL